MIDTYCNEAFCKKTLQKFIRVNSCQPDGNEADMVKMILESFPSDICHTVVEHGKNRQTLIIKINGETDNGGVAFVGHLDTVPCGDENLWKYPPLSGKEENGYIYGRGAVDMKSGGTAMVAVALSLFERKEKPKEPIYFCFTADEEKNGLGAVALVEQKDLKSVKEFFITEPSNEMIGVAEKGAIWFRIKVSGVMAHSSRPERGINAIERSIEFVQRLTETIDTKTEDPYLGKNTISITELKGGISTNMIPGYAEMKLDIRTLTTVNHEDVIESIKMLANKMEREQKNSKIKVELLNNRPAVGIKDGEPMLERIARTYTLMGMKPEKKGIYFYTDASQIVGQNYKPFVIMGPGDDQMAHQVNEKVSLDSVVRMAQFYKNYIHTYYY